MKTVSVFIIVTATCISAVAQVSNNVLSKQIVLAGKEVRIDTLMNVLSRQTGIGFSFNSNKIRPSNTIPVPNVKQTLAQWLDILQHKTGITHKIVGNHIILVDKKQPKSLGPPAKNVSSHSKTGVKKVSVVPDNREAKRTPTNVTGINESKEPLKSKAIKDDIYFTRQPGKVDPDSIAGAKINIAESDTLDLTFLTVDSLKEVKIKAVRVREDARPGDKVPAAAVISSNASLPLIPITKIGLGPEGLALSFERRLGNKMTIDLSLGAGGGYAITGDQFKYKVGGLRGPDIYFSAHPRFYYNREQRAIKGKAQSRNAGNYFGFRLKYITDMMAENFVVWDAFLLNLHWGMQRPLGKRWVVSGHAGPGYATAQSIFYNTWLKDFSRFYPSADIKIAYVLSMVDE